MCGITGAISYNSKSHYAIDEVVKELLIEATVRGHDATGYAYNHEGKLHINKEGVPANNPRMDYKMPYGVKIVTGHTRAGTKGSAMYNQNNHPFPGQTKDGNWFALCHNGIISSVEGVRKKHDLPEPEIQTDTYVAVQLLEQYEKITPEAIAEVCEELSGSFAFSILDSGNNLYLVRGDNPCVLIHLPNEGFIAYGSTYEIVFNGLCKTNRSKDWISDVVKGKTTSEFLELKEGDILHIDSAGTVTPHKYTVKQKTYARGGWNEDGVDLGNSMGAAARNFRRGTDYRRTEFQFVANKINRLSKKKLEELQPALYESFKATKNQISYICPACKYVFEQEDYYNAKKVWCPLCYGRCCEGLNPKDAETIKMKSTAMYMIDSLGYTREAARRLTEYWFEGGTGSPNARMMRTAFTSGTAPTGGWDVNMEGMALGPERVAHMIAKMHHFYLEQMDSIDKTKKPTEIEDLRTPLLDEKAGSLKNSPAVTFLCTVKSQNNPSNPAQQLIRNAIDAKVTNWGKQRGTTSVSVGHSLGMCMSLMFKHWTGTKGDLDEVAKMFSQVIHVDYNLKVIKVEREDGMLTSDSRTIMDVAYHSGKKTDVSTPEAANTTQVA